MIKRTNGGRTERKRKNQSQNHHNISSRIRIFLPHSTLGLISLILPLDLIHPPVFCKAPLPPLVLLLLLHANSPRQSHHLQRRAPAPTSTALFSVPTTLETALAAILQSRRQNKNNDNDNDCSPKVNGPGIIGSVSTSSSRPDARGCFSSNSPCNKVPPAQQLSTRPLLLRLSRIVCWASRLLPLAMAMERGTRRRV